jgi:hypothetical protein
LWYNRSTIVLEGKGFNSAAAVGGWAASEVVGRLARAAEKP